MTITIDDLVPLKATYHGGSDPQASPIKWWCRRILNHGESSRISPAETHPNPNQHYFYPTRSPSHRPVGQ